MDFNNQLSKTILSCCHKKDQDHQIDLIVRRKQNPNIILIYPQADLAKRLTQLDWSNVIICVDHVARIKFTRLKTQNCRITYKNKFDVEISPAPTFKALNDEPQQYDLYRFYQQALNQANITSDHCQVSAHYAHQRSGIVDGDQPTKIMRIIRNRNLTDLSINYYPDTYGYLPAQNILHAVIKNGSVAKLTLFDNIVWQL